MPFSRCNRARRGEDIRDRAGKNPRQSEMTNEHREDGTLGCFEPAREISLDFVTNKPRGASSREPLAGVAQNTLQKFDAYRRAKGFVEPHAIGNAPSCSTVDRFVNQIRVTEIDKGAVPEIVGGRPD